MRTILAFISAAALLAGCSTNNVTNDDSLKKYFEDNKATGCFAVMNNASGEFTMYNLKRYRDSAYAPGNTFDIVLGLTGLQTGKLASDSARLNVACGAEANATFASAFRTDCAPYFQELARQLGRDTLQRWVDSLGYGSKKIANLENAWSNGSLTVKPDEQLGLVKRLYFNQLPFFKLNQEIVKKAMLRDNTPQYRLAWKSGSVAQPDGNLVWYAGWVEENNHPYFFVLNYKGADAATGEKMLKGMLKQLDFLQGKK